jgi:tRNA nucleotidyltransferase (CCA-adding enzyme)
MKLPSELHPVLAALRRVGRPRVVGGAVRDWLLGLEAKDLDLEVAGASFDTLHRALAPLGATDVVGRSFGVIKLRLASGLEYDVSLPRRESKTGAGHRGFRVEPDPALGDAEAAARRDFTINALAWDPFTQSLIDPHGGEADLRARRLRHTSEAFVEDPLRVLRGMQLAARFDLRLDPATATLCRSIASAYGELAVERVWQEWAKWAEKSIVPSRGLALLAETGWLAHFPELSALVGCPQDPSWHPEGDVWTHTAHCCDALARDAFWRAAPPARRRVLLLAVLLHDVGKPPVTRREQKRGGLRWVSPGHEAAGVPLAAAFLRRIGAPLDQGPKLGPLVANHMVHHHGGAEGPSAQAVRRLARRLAPGTVEDLAAVMRADALGRPPLEGTESLVLVNCLLERAASLALADRAPRPILLGRHLLACGLRPGPDFKRILDRAFEAQLDGAFGDEENALIWLSKNLEDRPGAGS